MAADSSSSLRRCRWASAGDQRYIDYHDKEWGVPVRDDRGQFEFLTLESAQAGLSWSTILYRREGYRRAFADFDPVQVAAFGPSKIEELMQDRGIIRNRLKIKAAINNARCFLEIASEFGSFSHYIWSYTDGRTIVNHWRDASQIPAQSALSEALSKDLKRRGFRFVGPVIMYAHMQATGLINDHEVDCFRHRECLELSESGTV